MGHGWIGVDLDGTLAEYSGWQGADHIGKPIKAMLERVMRWLGDGKDVRLVTARASVEDPAERNLAIDAIRKWCVDHIGAELPVTDRKDFGMVELWDDRAVQVEKNTGVALVEQLRGELSKLKSEKRSLQRRLRRARKA